MNNWTIGRRILTGFLAVLLITTVLGLFTLFRFVTIQKNIVVLGDNTVPSLELQDEIRIREQRRVSALLAVSAIADERGRAEQIALYRTATDEAVDLLKKYELLLSDATDRELWVREMDSHNAFTPVAAKSLEYIDRDKRAGSNESRKQLGDFVTNTFLPSYAAVRDAVNKTFDYNVTLGTAAKAEAKDNASSAILWVSVTIVLAILLTLLIAWYVSRSVNYALRDITSNLDAGALQTASAARQVAMSSSNLSSGASEQSASVEETSSALEEMSSMIRSTADNALRAKSLSAEAREEARDGAQMMKDMMAAMASIDTSSAEVAKIVKNIDEIAFQTNILALNAAVEAARAGEAGAGFAVVADEVRSLAQRSAAAAKETADKIDAAIASSHAGSQCSVRVAASLEEIAERVAATDAIIAGIATAAAEQAQGVAQVSVAMAQVDKVTQSNVATAQDSAAAAEELDAQAETMADLVSHLRSLVGIAHPTGSRDVAAMRRIASPGRTALHSPSTRPSIPMPGDAGSSVDSRFRNF